MIQKIKYLFDCSIGAAEKFPLRKRIYHAVSIIALLWIPLALGVNLFIQVPNVTTALISTWLFFAILFCLSRFWGQSNLSLLIFGFGATILIVANYFINSGIRGPSLILFLLSIVLVLSIMPPRQFLFWLLINVIAVSSLVTFEYYNEGAIDVTYTGKYDYFIDILTTYISVVGVIGAVLFFLVKNYELEKNKAVKASQALEVANNSKTRLFSVLSHDLRSPLNSISGYLETLSKFELSSEERKSLEQNLLDDTRGMQTMLNNLLGWAKAQMEGGERVNKVWINGEDFLKDCLEIQQNLAIRKAIVISTYIDPKWKVFADRDMLKMVVTNLINNAIKFTPAGGHIQIRLEKLADRVRIHVIDNGIGMSQEKQDNLFTFQASSTYGTNYEKGIGLGLILCKEFIEQQNGKIFFVSEQEKGTTFTIEFAY